MNRPIALGLIGVYGAVSALSAQSSIVIDLSSQTLRYFEDNKTVFETPVSTGNIHHPTPTGTFKVFAKERYHKSTLYPIYADGRRGGAKMDFMMKFAPAVAIHEGEVVWENGRTIPVSHGCVRVPTKAAKKLFSTVKRGTMVVVKGEAPYDNSFNQYLKENVNIGDEMIYYQNDIYNGESNLNIAIETQDIEEIEEGG